MLRGCESYQPSTGQVRFLLGWLFADRHADDSPGRQNAFALLRLETSMSKVRGGQGGVKGGVRGVQKDDSLSSGWKLIGH